MNIVEYWIGRFRLWLGYCPNCNFDAPECDDCPVCNDWSSRYRPLWPVPKPFLEMWRERFDSMYAYFRMQKLSKKLTHKHMKMIGEALIMQAKVKSIIESE